MAIALDPQYAEAQANLGVLYGQQGKNSQAEQLLRQATENNPQYAQAFVNLGLVLAAQSRFPEAEQALRSALKIGEDNSQALTVLAMVLARTGRQAEAVTYFRKVIALDPKDPGSHINLGITLADQFNLEGASRNFRKPYVSIRMPPRPTTTRAACCSTCGATAMPSPNSKPPRAWTPDLPSPGTYSA